MNYVKATCIKLQTPSMLPPSSFHDICNQLKKYMYVGYKRLPLFWATQFPKKMTTSCVQIFFVSMLLLSSVHDTFNCTNRCSLGLPSTHVNQWLPRSIWRLQKLLNAVNDLVLMHARHVLHNGKNADQCGFLHICKYKMATFSELETATGLWWVNYSKFHNQHGAL